MLKKHLLKIIAVFLSLSFWLFIFSTSSFERSKMLELKLIPPSGLAVENDIPEKVELIVKGPRPLMRSFWKNFNALEVPVEGKMLADGKIAVPIIIKLENIPAGLSVVRVNPKIVTVSLEKKIKKVVPLKLQFVGVLDEEYRLVKKLVTPSSIMIEGPISLMRKISRIMVSPIDLEFLEGKGSMAVETERLNSKIKMASDGPILFSYSVIPKKANISIDVPVLFLSTLRKIKSNVAVAHLELMAEDKDSFGDKEKMIRVVADIPEGKRGKLRVELKCKLPEGIHLLQIRPRYISVVVK